MGFVSKIKRRFVPEEPPRTREGTYRCRSCGASFKSRNKWCSECNSTVIGESNTECETCGSSLFDARRQHCPNCGSEDVEQLH